MSFTLMELLLFGIVALLLGASLGLVLTKLFARENRSSRELERQLQHTVENSKAYRRQVSSHYVRTAQLANDLTESYSQLHNHLALGSATLLDTRGAQPLMRTIPSREQIEAISQPAAPTVVAPPLDYAPKTTPSEKGMLDEAFGLEKSPKEARDNTTPEDIYSPGQVAPTPSVSRL